MALHAAGADRGDLLCLLGAPPHAPHPGIMAHSQDPPFRAKPELEHHLPQAFSRAPAADAQSPDRHPCPRHGSGGALWDHIHDDRCGGAFQCAAGIWQAQLHLLDAPGAPHSSFDEPQALRYQFRQYLHGLGPSLRHFFLRPEGTSHGVWRERADSDRVRQTADPSAGVDRPKRQGKHLQCSLPSPPSRSRRQA